MTQRMNVAARGLFATPLAATEVPDAAARDAVLTAAILNRRGERPSVQACDAGGWHADREILPCGGDPVATIIGLAKALARPLTADRPGHTVRPQWVVHTWANASARPANVAYHPAGSIWSGPYDGDGGGCASDHPLGGESERHQARPDRGTGTCISIACTLDL